MFFKPVFFEEILVLTDFDQMKNPPSYTSLESYGSWLFNHIAQNTDHLTCQPSEFWGRSWTDFLDDPRVRPIPMFREIVKPDDTVGKYHVLVLTEVRVRYICHKLSNKNIRDGYSRPSTPQRCIWEGKLQQYNNVTLICLKVEELDLPEDPCNLDPGYDFYTCVQKNIIKKVPEYSENWRYCISDVQGVFLWLSPP